VKHRRVLLSAVVASAIVLTGACAPGTTVSGSGSVHTSSDDPTTSPADLGGGPGGGNGSRGSGSRGGGSHHHTATHGHPRPTPSKSTKNPPATTPTRSTSPSSAPSGPPGFGTPKQTRGDDWDLGIDPAGQTFTMRFSDLQAGVSGDLKRTDKTVEKVLPLRGDTRTARLRVFLSGYATAVAPTTIRMTVWVNGHATTKVYAGGQDGEFVQTVPVRLNGAPECRIKVQFHVNLNGSDGYIVVSAIDGSIV
jgi:hypothetical protein